MRWHHLAGPLSLVAALCMCSNAEKPAKDSSKSQKPLQVSATNLPPATTTNVESVQFMYLNLFRYNIWPNVQDKLSNPQPPPAGFVPPPPGTPTSTNPAPQVQAPVPGAQAQSKLGASVEEAAPTPPNTLQTLESDIDTEVTDANDLVGQTQKLLSDATLAKNCFTNLQGNYPEILMTAARQAALLYDLQHSPDCKVVGKWPIDDIIAKINLGPAIDTLFLTLNAAVTANDPKGTLLARHTAAQATLQGLLTSSSAATLDSEISYLETWQARSIAAQNATKDQWSPTVTLTCHSQWFGKTEQQIVSIDYFDMSASTPSQQTADSFTNSCLGSLTISSGIGISTVRSSTFAFTPMTDFSVNPPTTTPVIGYAADSRILPIYLGVMNYEFARKKSLGFDFAGGAGVGSSSAGTTSDFFLGPSFAFAHRAIFVSPSFHLTQRQTLQDGYKVGDPQGSLTSVPTINRWRYGFAITFTFPVLQTP